MLKYKKSLWISALALGILAAAAALVLLTVRAADGAIGWIDGAVLALSAVGGGWMVCLALRALRLLPATAAVPKDAPKKQQEQALAAIDKAKGKLDRRFSACLSALILILCAAVFLLAYGEAQTTEEIAQSDVQTGIFYVKARVLSIDDEEYRGDQDVEDIPLGSQTVTVEVKQGEYAGQILQVENTFSYFYGTVLKEGDDLTLSFSITNGELDGIMIQDYDRTNPMIFVVLGFLLITVLVGGKVGAKSLLGLSLTILCIFAVLIPLLLGGWPTIPTILGVCAFVTVVEFVILGGVNRKTVCAILGTICGVVFAALLGELACFLLRIDGFKMYSTDNTVEALLQIKQWQNGVYGPLSSLQIGDLLVGGILIAALGAVNDVAMSISSSMNELVAVNPNLTRKELFKSGMNIGRDMVGTMTNTLILAFVGNSLVMMIYLSSLSVSFQQLISSAYFSVQMVQALASSIGVILAVPLSVVIGMLLFSRPRRAK